MRTIIREFLKENGFEFEENVLRFTVECCGDDYDFLKLVRLIAENMEDWTYYYGSENPVKIDIDCGNETVRFNL